MTATIRPPGQTSAADHSPSSPAREPADAPPASARRWLVWGALAIGCALLLAWAIPAWHYGRTHESTDNAQVDGHIIPVLAKVGGYVLDVRANENQSVRQGDVLVQLDSVELLQRLAQAEADLAAAMAGAGNGRMPGQAEAAVQGAISQEAATEGQIIAARSRETKALADLARYEALSRAGAVAEAQLESVRTEAQAATAERQVLERQAAAGGAMVSSARAGVRLAQARLHAAQAVRDAAALQLSYTTIRAPAAGQVSRRQVEVGQLVQPGQPLFSIVADTGVYVTANLKETQLDQVRIGQPVDLEIDAFGGCEARGRVESISGATGAKFSLIPPENATGNFTKVVQRIPVRIAVLNGCGAGRPLRPGISVEAHIDIR